eukprot:3470003-Amphidinium_carterae.1
MCPNHENLGQAARDTCCRVSQDAGPLKGSGSSLCGSFPLSGGDTLGTEESPSRNFGASMVDTMKPWCADTSVEW